MPVSRVPEYSGARLCASVRVCTGFNFNPQMLQQAAALTSINGDAPADPGPGSGMGE